MLSYIIRRLLLMVPTLIGMTMVVFFVMALAPGGIGSALVSAEGNMRAEDRARIIQYYNKRYGLDQPKVVQYARWLKRVAPIGFKDKLEGWPLHASFGFKVPDLGESFLSKEPTLRIIGQKLPATLMLNLLSIPVVYLLAIVSGIYAARYRGKTFDVGTGTLYLALWSVPTMWSGVMMIGFLANRDFLLLFPTGDLHDTLSDTMQFLPHFTSSGFHRGWALDAGWHLILPVICLSLSEFAFVSKLMRSSVLENLQADYARTARAKGVSDQHVLFRHVLRNSVLPLITVGAAVLPGLLGGSVVVESIFSIQGMGKLMIEAIYQKDQELILAETLVVGIIGLVSLLLADILYAVADPRVTYE